MNKSNFKSLIKECVVEILQERLTEGFDPQSQAGPNPIKDNPYPEWNEKMRRMEEDTVPGQESDMEYYIENSGLTEREKMLIRMGLQGYKNADLAKHFNVDHSRITHMMNSAIKKLQAHIRQEDRLYETTIHFGNLNEMAGKDFLKMLENSGFALADAPQSLHDIVRLLESLPINSDVLFFDYNGLVKKPTRYHTGIPPFSKWHKYKNNALGKIAYNVVDNQGGEGVDYPEGNIEHRADAIARQVQSGLLNKIAVKSERVSTPNLAAPVGKDKGIRINKLDKVKEIAFAGQRLGVPDMPDEVKQVNDTILKFCQDHHLPASESDLGYNHQSDAWIIKGRQIVLVYVSERWFVVKGDFRNDMRGDLHYMATFDQVMTIANHWDSANQSNEDQL